MRSSVVLGTLIVGVVGWWFLRSDSAATPPAPTAIKITAPFSVRAGATLTVRATVSPADAASSELHWWSTAGRIVSQHGDEVVWLAPLHPGRCRLAVVAAGAGGTKVEDVVTFEVVLAPPGSPAEEELAQRARTERVRGAQADEEEIARLTPVAMQDEVATSNEMEERYKALTRLGDLYLATDRYEEAADVFARQRRLLVPGKRDYKKVMEKTGIAAYFLGQDDLAIKSIQLGGEYSNGMSRYFLGRLLEERGDYEGAIAAYLWAARRHDNMDAIFRAAWLVLTRRHDAAQAAQLIADASTYHPAEHLLERLAQDPDLRLLHDAWQSSGLQLRPEPGWDVAVTVAN